MFIALNPSTADETVDDPTIRRCIRFAFDWGYSGVYMVNLFGFRATDPKEMKAQGDPFGADNHDWLVKTAEASKLAVACWGVNGSYVTAGKITKAMLERFDIELYHLGLTKDGHPRHPLYLKLDTVPVRWI